MATTHTSTGSDARERSRLAHGPGTRLVASGGPVATAILVGRGEGTDGVIDQPGFLIRSPDLTAVAIGVGCVSCWIAALSVCFGGVL